MLPQGPVCLLGLDSSLPTCLMCRAWLSENLPASDSFLDGDILNGGRLRPGSRWRLESGSGQVPGLHHQSDSGQIVCPGEMDQIGPSFLGDDRAIGRISHGRAKTRPV